MTLLYDFYDLFYPYWTASCCALGSFRLDTMQRRGCLPWSVLTVSATGNMFSSMASVTRHCRSRLETVRRKPRPVTGRPWGVGPHRKWLIPRIDRGYWLLSTVCFQSQHQYAAQNHHGCRQVKAVAVAAIPLCQHAGNGRGDDLRDAV